MRKYNQVQQEFDLNVVSLEWTLWRAKPIEFEWLMSESEVDLDSSWGQTYLECEWRLSLSKVFELSQWYRLDTKLSQMCFGKNINSIVISCEWQNLACSSD